jgi:hypothetical protein
MSRQADEDWDHPGVHQILGRQIAQHQLQHWVLSRLLTREIALREKRTSMTGASTPSSRRPPPRHVCARHDDRESDRLVGPVVVTPTQEQIDDLKSKIDESARQLEFAEEQYRVFRTQIGSHYELPESHWRLPLWRFVIGLEELPVC